MLGYRGGNRSVFKHPASDYGSRRNPWRNQYGRHAHAQTVEAKLSAGAGIVWGGDESIGLAGRRHDMIIDSSVLVVHHQQDRRLPQVGIALDRIVDGCNEQFAS